MNKNTIIALILSSFVIAGAMYLQYTFYPPIPVQEQQTAAVPQPEQSATIPQNTFITEAPEEKITIEQTPETIDGKEEFITVKTNIAEITLTNRGGDITSFKLLEHTDSKGKEYVEMVKNLTDQNRAF